MFLSLLFITLAGFKACNAGAPFAGPFDCIVKNPFVCEDEGTKEMYFNNTIITKKSRKAFYVSSEIHTRVVTDDTMDLHLEVSVWGNGGWKPKFFSKDFPGVCKTMGEKIPTIWDALLKMGGVTECPIQPGDYHIKDVESEVDIKMPSIPYNLYKVELSLLKDKVKLGCVGFVVDVVPKDKKKP